MKKPKKPKKPGAGKVTSATGVMTFNYAGDFDIPEDGISLPELEKRLDLASARLTYVIEQKRIWDERLYSASREFNAINTKYKQKKNGFTDEEIRSPKSSTAVWSYAK